MAEPKLPSEFRQVLENYGCLAQFEALPPSHRREHLKWIAEAKQPATRERRILKAVEMIRRKG
jgi:uncharacterized protein YdeI (YjbR/CyaY-like superfamily)